ncbi:Zinc finger BED domain-containing protein [Melia azedarach]|uniref:Zinc finger BED domain-containing protein n=1 Tax=Melia azedarach TaxID=155640 RepID=A0ACC1WUU3_MELAZ|nr:Zinc finger BED domain-containing protein [Melia azedarach]
MTSNDSPRLVDGVGDGVMNDDNFVRSKERFRSVVWEHFDRVDSDGMRKAVCKYCKSKLVARCTDGTRHLHAHMKTCIMRKQKEISSYSKVKVEEGNENLDTFTSHSKKLRVLKVEEGNANLDTFTFDPNETREMIAKLIIVHEYPLSCVDHEYFKKMIESLNPMFNCVSRNTIKNDIMEIYQMERAKVLSLFERNKSRVAITTDMWTCGSQTMGYTAIIGHFIDDSWILHGKILRFMHVKLPHTGEVLCDTLFNTLMDFNMNRKVSALTVDNCSSNDRMVLFLLEKIDKSDLIMSGRLFHIRCTAHILNLIVEDGLFVISNTIVKVRDSVSYWRTTTKRREKFDEVARRLNISCTRELVLDCTTRWNSTYLMIVVALEYKAVFCRLKLLEIQYKSLPSEQEWELAQILANKLKPFYDVTEIFSGTKYPTSNLFFVHICEIRLSLDEWLGSSYEEIKKMATIMIEKFEKYWKDVHGILALATILDPRYKMKLIEYYFPMIYGDDSLFQIERVHNFCGDLIKDYESKLKLREGSYSSSASSSSHSISHSLMSFSERQAERRLGFRNFVKSNVIEQKKTELQSYLDDGILVDFDNFDILSWWRVNQCQYPLLSKIARDILAIPVSTVNSESAFNAGGRVVSLHRRRLHPNTVEALMCTQSWLRQDDKPILTSMENATNTFMQGDVEDCKEVDEAS